MKTLKAFEYRESRLKFLNGPELKVPLESANEATEDDLRCKNMVEVRGEMAQLFEVCVPEDGIFPVSKEPLGAPYHVDGPHDNPEEHFDGSTQGGGSNANRS